MARKRSKKKTDFNQYLPLLLIGALVVAFVFLGAGPTGKFGATGGTPTYAADDCHSPNSLLLSEGSQPPINCCYNYMGDELWCVGDELPRDESPPPPPGQECTLTGDCDGDGYTILDGDCMDLDPLVSPADNDGDGYSTCDGDCNDNDASLSPADNDGDGLSTCGGDCNDDGTSITVAIGSVFITSDKFNGDFGGVDGANDICGCSAAKGQLNGVWKAIISDSTQKARTVVRGDWYPSPLYNLNGDIIDEEIKTEFKYISPMAGGVNQTLENPVRYDEYGIEVPAGMYLSNSVVPVWTGSNYEGEPYSSIYGITPPNCNDWSSSSASNSGQIGDGGIKLHEKYPQYSINWHLMWGSSRCDKEAHLYCIRTDQP